MFAVRLEFNVKDKSLKFSLTTLFLLVFLNFIFHLFLPTLLIFDKDSLFLVSKVLSTTLMFCYVISCKLISFEKIIIRRQNLIITFFVFLTSLIFFKVYQEVIDLYNFNSDIHYGFDYSLYFLPLLLVFAILEEIIFRGLIQKSLYLKVSPSISIIISSFLFAFYHASPVYFIYYLCLGFLTGYLYYKTKSLFYTTVTHFLYNFVLAYILI